MSRHKKYEPKPPYVVIIKYWHGSFERIFKNLGLADLEEFEYTEESLMLTIKRCIERKLAFQVTSHDGYYLLGVSESNFGQR